jgi:isoamylase
MRAWPGRPFPLGATWDGEGTNFAIFSENATAVELCLFDQAEGTAETERITLIDQERHVWHVYLPDVRPCQLYGYRVHGPYAPADGHRFNPAKLLIDPYAKAITGAIRWHDALFGYRVGDPALDLSRGDADSAPFVPKSIVVESAFSWGDDRAPRTPWNRTVIYECHVKGLTQLHPKVPPALRGTYLGLATDPVLDHLLSLGVTAIELMPVHHFVADRHLVERGLTNYWGYNSIGFFAPDVRYATGALGQQVTEFKTMVKRLHRAGIEIILDVVYNHTGEGNHLGPTLSLRGIDNAAYYRLVSGDPRHYVDYTGCGNSLNMLHPRAIQLLMDSLRYWVHDMHVDGFRFDLAPVLARELHEVNRLATFFEIIRQDPILGQAKLIAEPWDLGPGGYQVGNFPDEWTEWNGKYRDTMRRFWRGDPGQLADLGYRLSGSSDLYGRSTRTPWASINFVTCHDGFTLRDLVSYERKHNEANGEDGRDGADENWSCNWGVEGPTDDPEIVARRERAMRNLLATLAFSQGVPMLSAGDELGRTQAGNNNAYCQDSALSWVPWSTDDGARDLLAFARHVLGIRQTYPVLRRRSFFEGRPIAPDGMKDVTWLHPDGREMRADDWADPQAATLGMLLDGEASDEVDERGHPLTGASLLLLLNGGARPCPFTLPVLPGPGRWRELVHTERPARASVPHPTVRLSPSTLVLLAWGAVS